MRRWFRSSFGQLATGLGLIHLVEAILADVAVASIARFAPVPIWGLYGIIIALSLVIIVIFTYIMARYAWAVTEPTLDITWSWRDQ